MQVKHSVNQDGSLEINLSLTAQEVCCLKNDLWGLEGVIDWHAAASQQKILKCKERMIRNYVEACISKSKQVPAGESAIILSCVNEPDYQDREALEGRKMPHRVFKDQPLIN